MRREKEIIGYLPQERPTTWKLLLYAIQQVIVMFPATVTVALITGFQVSTTIFASGLATLCFILITGRKIPLYYGSSFAYLTAIASMVAAEGTAEQIAQFNSTGILPKELISYAQFGIILSGLVSIAAGLLVKFFGRHAVEKILPPTITGPVAMIIGLTLAGNALTDAAPKNVICPDLQNTALVQEYAAADYQDYLAKIGAAENPLEGEAQIKEQIVLLEKTVDKLPEGKSEARSNLESELKSLRKTYTSGTDWVWVVSLVTLLATELFSKYLKGFLGQLPLLLGALTGCAVAFVILLINDDLDLFRSMSAAALAESPWKSPHGIIAVPAFSFPKVSWAAVAAIMPIAIATIPESTAHMYQLDIYVNDIAKKKGKKLGYNLIDMLDRNLIGDGLCDMISGAVGGPAGTNYGENISTMAITRVFSVPVLAVAAIFAMVISFFTPLIQIVYGIPLAVIGGLEIYLFGAIAAQGIAIMIDKKADMFSAKNIAVIASIMVIGIGGNYAFGGNIPFFGLDVPCIAGAAIFGILLNLLLSIGDKKHREEQIETVSPEEQKES